MTPPLNPYSVEAHYPDVEYLAPQGYWLDICNDRLEFCRGFLQARLELPLPHVAMRLVRHKDGKVLHTADAQLEVSAGMVAGYPTGEQQLGAIRRALGRVQYHAGYVSYLDAAIARRALRVVNWEELS